MKIVTQDGKRRDLLIEEGTYIHHQDVSSAVWTINHNLDKYPSVTLVNSVNEVFLAHIDYTSKAQIVVTMSGSNTGKAYLN